MQRLRHDRENSDTMKTKNALKEFDPAPESAAVQAEDSPAAAQTDATPELDPAPESAANAVAPIPVSPPVFPAGSCIKCGNPWPSRYGCSWRCMTCGTEGRDR